LAISPSRSHYICQTVEDAELLVYLVKEEKDIYVGVFIHVCHLATWDQPS